MMCGIVCASGHSSVSLFISPSVWSYAAFQRCCKVRNSNILLRKIQWSDCFSLNYKFIILQIHSVDSEKLFAAFYKIIKPFKSSESSKSSRFSNNVVIMAAHVLMLFSPTASRCYCSCYHVQTM